MKKKKAKELPPGTYTVVLDRVRKKRNKDYLVMTFSTVDEGVKIKANIVPEAETQDEL